MGDNWVELRWQAPHDKGTPEVSYYLILTTTITTNTSLSSEEYPTDGNETSFVLNELLPSQVYTIRVAGVTELTGSESVSNYSGSITVTTLGMLK